MDPYLESRLRKIKEENEDAFANGNHDVLFEKFNEGQTVKMPDVATFQGYLNAVDFSAEDEKKNPNSNETIDPLGSDTDAQSPSSEEEFSSERLFEENKNTTKALLDYIADIESVGGSYDSYQGSFKNGSPQFDFQSMTIQGILDWQENNGDKAVGRYQFKPDTLREMLDNAGLTEKDTFSPSNQDKLAMELLKRRGYEDYLKGGAYNDFAYGLAKEWAAIPLVEERDGKLAGESYYKGVGSNKAKGNPEELVKIFKDRETGIIRNKRTTDYYNRQNIQAQNELFSSITPDFIRDVSEEELETKLKKYYQHLGFEVKQEGAGLRDRIAISHPSIKEPPFVLDMGSLVVGRLTEDELIEKSAALKDYMSRVGLEVQPEYRYGADFDKDPMEAFFKMSSEMLLPVSTVDNAKMRIQDLEAQLKETPEYISSPDSLDSYEVNPLYTDIKDKIRQNRSILSTQQARYDNLTRSFDNLADNKGGLSALLQNPEFAREFSMRVQAGQINPEMIKMPSIRIDGRLSNFKTLRDMLIDTTMRDAIHSGEIDVEVINDGSAFAGTVMEPAAKFITDKAQKLIETNTKSSGVTGQLDWTMRSTILPLVAGGVEIVANVGEFLLDVAQMPSDLFDEVNKLIYTGEGEQAVIEKQNEKVGEHYQSVFDQARSFAETNIRSQVPETSGDFLESESFGELMQKGSTQTFESLPYMAMFAVNPTLGVGVTGMSTYGSSLNEMREYQTMAKAMMQSDGYVPDSLDEYLRLSKWQMRSVAAAKGIGEAAITGFTTAKYFKGLSSITKPGMTPNQFREAAKVYRRGALRNIINEVPKAGRAEFLEEGLVAIENMAVDHLFGIKDYQASDYTKAFANAGASAFFSTTPLSTLGAMKQKKQSRKLFEGAVYRTMLSRNSNHNDLVKQRLQNLNRLESLSKQGKNNETLLQDDINLQKEMLKEEQRTLDIIQNSTVDQLTQFTQLEVDIQNIVQEAKVASGELSIEDARKSTDISGTDTTGKNIPNDIKRRTEKMLKEKIQQQEKIFKEMDPKHTYTVSNDAKKYVDSFVGIKGEGQDVVMHSTADVDGVVSSDRLMKSKTAEDSGIETLPDTADQEGGSDAVFFTNDPKWDQGNRNGKFFFDRNKMTESLTPGTNKKEFELLSDGDVKLSRENGLLGIEFVEGLDVADAISEPTIKGQEQKISKEEQEKRLIEIDKKNAENYTKNRKAILKKAQDAADKFGVPVVVTQHRGNHQMYDAIGYKSVINDEVVYPSNSTAEDYASYGTIIQDQVRATPANTDSERKYRNAAQILSGLRKAAMNKIPFGDEVVPDDNHFTRAPEDVQRIIDYMSHVTEDDLNSDQKGILNTLANKLNEVQKNPATLENVPLSRYANELEGGMKLLDEVRMATPIEMLNKKISPMARLESLFTQKGVEFATTNHVLSFMFKRSSMKQPILTISNNIDRNIARIEKEGEAIRDAYESLSFLSKKVDPKKYFADENLAERVMLSHLGKYEELGLEGKAAAESRQEQFDKKKTEIKKYIDNITANDNSKDAKKKKEIYSKIYDRIVANAEDYASVEQDATSFNREGVQYLRSLFETDKQDVYNHMKNYHGRIPTKFKNYLPLILSNVGKTSGVAEGTYSDYQGMQVSFNKSTGTMKESSQQTGALQGDLNFDNYENVILDHLISGRKQMATMADVYKLKGLYESKGFSDMFDVERTASLGARKGGETDFERLRDFLLHTLAGKVDRANKVTTNKRVKATATANAKRVGRTLLKISQTKRLGSLFMRPKQYYSAAFAQLPNLSARARTFMLQEIGNFTTFRSSKNMRNDANKMAILSASLTQGRSGKAKIGTELDNIRVEPSKTTGGQIVSGVLDQVDAVSERIMQNFLAQTDQLAANATYLAFYMDYEMKNNPDVKKEMTQEEFFEYAAKNVNEKAVAYADEQVGRSQTQSDPWNSKGLYGQDNSANMKILADMLYLFGRFQQNRKVGIANDISILSDDFASSSDRAMAGRRLASAVIEIGVFKLLGPVFSAGVATALTPLMASLLGWDEELDVAINAYRAWAGADGEDFAKRMEFSLTNYERNISREFTSSLIDGMIPAPVPPIMSEYAYGGINALAKSMGADDDIVNVYNPFARGLFEELGPVTDGGIAEFALESMGAYSLVAEDVSDFYNAFSYLSTGKMPPYLNMGKDRYVKPIAKTGADVLAVSTILGFVVPSAEINTFNRLLRGKIERDYLTTVAPPKVAEPKKPLVKNPKQNADKDVRRRTLRDKINESLRSSPE